MGEPLKAVCVLDQTVGENSYLLYASITESGDLNLYGSDMGPVVQEWWHGTDEYEYWFTVPAAEKDAMLLILLQERCQNKDFELMAWLKSHGITYDFNNWFSFK